jgi:hypothetical protein
MSDESVPEWLSLLDTLLVRNWELERSAQGRDPEPLREGVPLRLTNTHAIVAKLNQHFTKNRCRGYVAELAATDVTIHQPQDRTARMEAAALHAVQDWLKPTPDYPPFTTSQERRELDDLRMRLDRAVQDRLNVLLTGAEKFGRKKTEGTKPPLEKSKKPKDRLKLQVYQRIDLEHKAREEYAQVVKRLEGDKDFIDQLKSCGLKKLDERLVRNAVVYFGQRRRRGEAKKRKSALNAQQSDPS